MFSEAFKTSRRAHDPHWLQKFILRLVQVVISIISLIIASVAVALPYNNGDDYYYGVGIAYVFNLAAWIYTILWAVANFIRLGVSEAPIHPGAIVGVDLIAWLLWLLAEIFNFSQFAIFLIARSQCASYQSDDNDPYYDDTYEDAWCSINGNSLGLAADVFMAFGGLAIFIIHFYLFVRGCIETHRIRRARYAAVQAVPLNGNYAYVPPTATHVPPETSYYAPAGQPVYNQNYQNYQSYRDAPEVVQQK